MFQRKELERLHSQKEQLILQCDHNRQQLLSDWQRLQSSELWVGEILCFTRRHPFWVVTLAAAGGVFVARTLRRPRTFMKRVGQVGKFASVALSAWKLFRRKRKP